MSAPSAPNGETFELARPQEWRGGVIFASPHSGRSYPEWFIEESSLDPLTLRSSEDAFVDQLIAPAVAAGAVALCAHIPRAIVDLNRSADELDPAAVAGVPAGKMNQRILSGLGVIPRVVAHGRPIRQGKLPAAEARRRINAYWHPYHAALGALMDEAMARFGRAVLIDVHSMPHAALTHLAGQPPQIVLGDRNGASADAAVTSIVHDALTRVGLRVRRNSPFAGAYIAGLYGAPMRGRHVVQLEIDRALYMDELTVRPHHGFSAFAERFGRAVQELARLTPDDPIRIAAE